jgi:hypothetical protein
MVCWHRVKKHLERMVKQTFAPHLILGRAVIIRMTVFGEDRTLAVERSLFPLESDTSREGQLEPVTVH